jgi:hypothetical protein
MPTVKFKSDLVCPCPAGNEKIWNYLRDKYVTIGLPCPDFVLEAWHKTFNGCPSDVLWQVDDKNNHDLIQEVFRIWNAPHGDTMFVCRCVLEMGD